jgi:hypothetical protein
VVVAGVVALGTGSGELCSSGLLRAGVDVLDLSLSEDTSGLCQLVLLIVFHEHRVATHM